ncbi:MAG: c-type cytochrome [Solirubrobacterales bacterium]|nr:c-type cytochrome [Solirubrobacterales bacterium]
MSTGPSGWLAYLAALLFGVAGSGQNAGPTSKPPARLHGKAAAEFRAGQAEVGYSGCLGCHRIGNNGNDGPGPALTHIGARLSPAKLSTAMKNPTAPMPSFAGMAKSEPRKFRQLVFFLSQLR